MEGKIRRWSIPFLLCSIAHWPAPLKSDGSRASSLAARILLLTMSIPKLSMGSVVRAWALLAQQSQRQQAENTIELLQAELSMLQDKVGRKQESMWQLRKPDLVERAVEPGLFAPAEARRETVAQLRMLLKITKEPREPKLLPPGVSSMKKVELTQWCLERCTVEN